MKAQMFINAGMDIYVGSIIVENMIGNAVDKLRVKSSHIVAEYSSCTISAERLIAMHILVE